jgi:hypothetical protein
LNRRCTRLAGLTRVLLESGQAVAETPVGGADHRARRAPGDLAEPSAEFPGALDGRDERPDDRLEVRHQAHDLSRPCHRDGRRLPYRHQHGTPDESATQLALTDIGRIHPRTSVPLFVDNYAVTQETCALILADGPTNWTVAGGIVESHPS